MYILVLIVVLFIAAYIWILFAARL